MSVEIADNGESIELLYTNDDGESASVSCVGMTKSEVEDMSDELVTRHNLAEKAGQTE